MNKLLRIVRAGFGFGIVPLVLLTLGSAVMYVISYLGDGSLVNAPIAPSTTVAMMMMFAAFGVMLSLAGIAFAATLRLAKRIGGRMPEGTVAVVLGTLFAVSLTAAVPMMRPLAVGIGCASDGSLLRTICATHALLATSQQAANVFTAVILLLLGYAGVAGLVIGGMVAETHNIVIAEPVKAQAIPAHILRKPALTRDEWLRKFAEEDQQS